MPGLWCRRTRLNHASWRKFEPVILQVPNRLVAFRQSFNAVRTKAFKAQTRARRQVPHRPTRQHFAEDVECSGSVVDLDQQQIFNGDNQAQ